MIEGLQHTVCAYHAFVDNVGLEVLPELGEDNVDRNGERILDGISVYTRVPPIPSATIGYCQSVQDSDSWIPIIPNPPDNFESWCYKHGVTFLPLLSLDSIYTTGPIMRADWTNIHNPTLIPRIYSTAEKVTLNCNLIG